MSERLTGWLGRSEGQVLRLDSIVWYRIVSRRTYAEDDMIRSSTSAIELSMVNGERIELTSDEDIEAFERIIRPPSDTTVTPA